jgi:hypothetical protein
MNAGADYKVVRDDHFDLDEGERRELVFDLPPDQPADQPLIVAWKSRPSPSKARAPWKSPSRSNSRQRSTVSRCVRTPCAASGKCFRTA